jgi:host factor-I protein
MTQDDLLSGLRDARTPLSLFLINGIRLSGITIEAFDTYTLKLRSHGETQLVYKANIVTIVPETEFAGRKLHDEPVIEERAVERAPREVEISVKRRRRVG